MIMYYCTCDRMSVCGCMLMYVWYFYVLVYCSTHYGRGLMRSRRCLLNGLYFIPWTRVYRNDVL